MATTLVPLLAATLALAGPVGRPDLGGRVVDASGRPVPGARVFIYTAAARVGVNPFCPSCYADCAKTAETDADGGFAIRSLDPSLIFRVLVVGEGYAPAFVDKVDPLSGPIEAKVKPIDPARLAPRHALRGKVVDPEGSPVAGAEVTPHEIDTEAFRGYGPGVVDEVAVTNLRGEFVLTSRSPARSIGVRVNARGLATRIFPMLPVAEKVHELRLGRGVEVTGLVVRDGRPMPGVVVGLVQQSRWTETFLGHVEIASDESGRFRFSNVAPDDRFFAYGIMDGLRPAGGLGIVPFETRRDGTTADLGTLAVKPGHRLAGRLVLAGGKPIPPHTRVLISRDQAWDSQMVELDAEGRFVVEGLPTEVYGVSTTIKGYELAAKNACASPLNPGMLEGLVDRDIPDLTILYEAQDPSQGRRWPSLKDPAVRKAIDAFAVRRKQAIAGIAPARGGEAP
jgi:hypothetical protein